MFLKNHLFSALTPSDMTDHCLDEFLHRLVPKTEASGGESLYGN